MGFTTDAGVTLLPMASAAPLRLRAIDRQGEKWWELAMLRLLVKDGDATHELESGRSPEILPADGGPGEATLVLSLSHEIPNPVPHEPFSLLFDLEVPSHVEPQWAWPRWHGLPEVAQLAIEQSQADIRLTIQRLELGEPVRGPVGAPTQDRPPTTLPLIGFRDRHDVFAAFLIMVPPGADTLFGTTLPRVMRGAPELLSRPRFFYPSLLVDPMGSDDQMRTVRTDSFCWKLFSVGLTSPPPPGDQEGRRSSMSST